MRYAAFVISILCFLDILTIPLLLPIVLTYYRVGSLRRDVASVVVRRANKTGADVKASLESRGIVFVHFCGVIIDIPFGVLLAIEVLSVWRAVPALRAIKRVSENPHDSSSIDNGKFSRIRSEIVVQFAKLLRDIAGFACAAVVVTRTQQFSCTLKNINSTHQIHILDFTCVYIYLIYK